MPAIKPGDLVLVTGASGFIAAHTVQQFLQEGYNVRGTVRSDAKGRYLEELFEKEKRGGKFEYVIVEDIAKEDAFDEAVKGVDAVAHMASPFHFNAEDPKELFEPAVNGTVGVLKSLQKNNPNVKRVVITSSFAAVMDPKKSGYYHYTEKDWNEASILDCEENGSKATGQSKYRASKTLAEKAFWKFFEDEKPAFDGVTINPPLVLGPIIHQVKSVEDVNTSVAAFIPWMTGKKTEADLPAPGGNYVDVRDVALAHVRALTVSEAGGQRFATSHGQLSGNDCCVALHKYNPDIKDVPKGDESAREKINSEIAYFDGSKLTKVLGIKYRTEDETMIDMAKALHERFGL